MLKKQKLSYTLPLLIIWTFLLSYFYANDLDAFILFLILPPIFIYMLYISIRKKYIAMAIFFSLVFISQAVNPAFFFLTKNDFINSTGWAVKDFNFDLLEFFFIYKDMYLLLICIFIFTLIFNKTFISPKSRITIKINNPQACPKAPEKQQVINNKTNGKEKMYTRYIYLFIIFIAIPLNIFMYTNGIGISTVDPQRLPFKLVGITFYIRNYIIPALVMYLYFKSGRTRTPTTLILLYGLLVGILSLSKGNVVLTLLPVILFSYLDGKKLRLFISILYAILLYLMVSWARQFVFISNIGSLEMIVNIFSNIKENDFFEWNFISIFFAAISDRLYGAQYTILAHQFALANNVKEIVNFLYANTDNLSNIILTEVFGLQILDGVVMGVNIGYLATVILLANKNLFLLIFMALVTAMYLTISEVIITKYIYGNKAFNLIGYPLGFFMVFFLYDAVIGKFYFILILSVMGLFLIKLMSNFRITYKKANCDGKNFAHGRVSCGGSHL